jgi:N-acetylmuramoyl-L-alanine amidase
MPLVGGIQSVTGIRRLATFLAVIGSLLYAPTSIARTGNVTGHHAAAKHDHSVSGRARPKKFAAHRKAIATKHAKNRPVAPASPSHPLIVIDPGHGGRDPGAIGVAGTAEKTITLKTANELRRSLEATGRYRIAMTRTGDSTVSLARRLAFARSHDADLFIAIHADASPDHSARGASVYVSSRTETTRFAASQNDSGRIARALAATEPQPEPGSAWLQYSMIEQLDDDVRMTAAPARHAQLYVLGSRTIPSVLLEVGFLSNRQDEALLRKPAHRSVLVRAIRDAIDDYFSTIKGRDSRT